MYIQLSDHFTVKRLLRFSLPSILMMVFTSIYGVVDGFFVSNFAGKSSFAAVNFIMPYLMILGGFGFIIGTGGNAYIGKLLGEGNVRRANGVFSALIYFTVATGAVIAVTGYFTVRPVAALLGADPAMLDLCTLYGKISMLGIPAVTLQYTFQNFCILAEKPKLGLFTTVGAGVCNMVLDAVLVGVFDLGIAGAAAATVASQVVGGVLPLIYFTLPNPTKFRIGVPEWHLSSILHTLGNGSSEFVSNISMSVVGMLYNYKLMEFAKEDGVSAYGVLMYVNFVFISVFIGYSVGVAPVISFHYGAKDTAELHSLLKKSLCILTALSAVMFLSGELLARPLAHLFVGYDTALTELTLRAFRIFSFAFLLASIPIFGSTFFTALNNGKVSAAVSFLRTAVFQVAAVLLLPVIFGIDGVWFSVVAAELAAAAVTALFYLTKRKKYGY